MRTANMLRACWVRALVWTIPHQFGQLIAYTDGYHEFALYGVVLSVTIHRISPLVRKLMRGVH